MSDKPLINLTIDGKEIAVPAGTTVLKAAAHVKKEIPHFCYHEGLPIVGQCRMCYVEIEGMPKLATSCSTTVAEGMKVLTDSPKVKQGQNATLEFVLLDHPLDCPICDRGGECKLQDYTYEYGPPRSRMIDEKEELLKHQPISENIVLDQERCILCTRCVRFSSHVDGRSELVVNERGSHSCINVFDNRPMQSNFQGNVVDLCPVGALTAKDYRFKARPWELKKHDAICTGCSMGCNIEIHTKHRHPGIARPDGQLPKPKIERLVPRENTQINDWWMCDKGRWGYHFHNVEENRIREPQLRRAKSSALSTVSFKEIQLTLEEISQKSSSPWEFWISDEASHEEIEWAKDLQKSWSARGRQVSERFNNTEISQQIVSVLQKRSITPADSSIFSYNHYVSFLPSPREMELEVAILGLKMGQRVRNDGVKWSQRDWSNLVQDSDDRAQTLYLIPVPRSLEDLQRIEKLPSDAKVMVLWRNPNSRGLLDEGIAPLEALGALLSQQKAKGPVFVFGQSNRHPKSPALVQYAKSASHLVLVDSFGSELSQVADVILPVDALYESHFTFTNAIGIKQKSAGIQLHSSNIPQLRKGSESPVSASLKLI